MNKNNRLLEILNEAIEIIESDIIDKATNRKPRTNHIINRNKSECRHLRSEIIGDGVYGKTYRCNDCGYIYDESRP